MYNWILVGHLFWPRCVYAFLYMSFFTWNLGKWFEKVKLKRHITRGHRHSQWSWGNVSLLVTHVSFARYLLSAQHVWHLSSVTKVSFCPFCWKDQLLIFISSKPFLQSFAQVSGQSGCPLERRCRPVRPCLIHCVDTRPSVWLHIHMVAVVRSSSTPGRPSLWSVTSARRWRWSGKQVNALIPNGGSIQRRSIHACSSRFGFCNLQETRCSIPAQRRPRGVSDDGFDSVTLGSVGAR